MNSLGKHSFPFNCSWNFLHICFSNFWIWIYIYWKYYLCFVHIRWPYDLLYSKGEKINKYLKCVQKMWNKSIKYRCINDWVNLDENLTVLMVTISAQFIEREKYSIFISINFCSTVTAPFWCVSCFVFRTIRWTKQRSFLSF